MSKQDQVLTIPLTGGIDNRAAQTAVAPGVFVSLLNVSFGEEPGLHSKCIAETSVTLTFPADPQACTVVVAGDNVPDLLACTPKAGSYIMRGSDPPDVLGAPVFATIAVTGADLSPQTMWWPCEVSDSYTLRFNVDKNFGFSGVSVDGISYITGIDESQTTPGQYEQWIFARGDEDGKIYLQKAIVDDDVDPNACGITKHDGAIRLWTASAAGEVFGREVTPWDGSSVAIGSATTTGITCTSAAFSSYSTGDGNASYAFMAAASTSAGSMRIVRIDISTYATTVITYAAEIVASPTLAIADCNVGGTSYLAAAWSSSAGVRAALVTTSGMSTTVSPFTVDATVGNSCGIAFHANNRWSGVTNHAGFVVAHSDYSATLGTNEGYTEFKFYTTAGSNTDTKRISWMKLARGTSTDATGAMAAHGQVRVGTSEIYPYFALVRQWGNDGSTSLYIEDPAVMVVSALKVPSDSGTRLDVSPIARLGTDIAIANPVCGIWQQSDSGKLHVGYECYQAGLLAYDKFVVRVSVVDLYAKQARSVVDANGGCFIAAAQPAYWDGAEITEYGPLHKPRIVAVTTGGSGPNLTGDYSFRAVVTWRDSFGQIHRSAPSLPVTISPAGTPPIVRVSAPFTTRDGVAQYNCDVELYITEDGGDRFYRMVYQGVPIEASSVSGGLWVFDTIRAVTPALSYEIYSTGASGEELLPNAPPCAYDAAIVGDRCWILDAEDRTRVMYSKRKSLLVAHEFPAEFEVRIPSAGKLHGIADLDGSPLFLGSKGCFVLFGNGPTDNGFGEAYDNPRKVTEYACTQRNSIVKTPIGVMFASDSRFSIVGAGGAKTFENIELSTSIVGTTLDTDRSEVTFWSASGDHYVYCWTQDKWARRSPGGSAYTAAHDVYTVTTSPAIYYVNKSAFSSSSGTQGYWQTGIIRPAGDMGDVSLKEIVILAKRSGSHGFTVTVSSDYGLNSFTRTFSAATVTSITQGGYYTARVCMPNLDARSVQVSLTETDSSGNAMQPISMTLIYGVGPGIQRRFLQGASV